jgi:hypothetical protein
MIKERGAMEGEMDRRIVYGGENFFKDKAKTYDITEKVKLIGQQRGKIKGTVPFTITNEIYHFCRQSRRRGF